MKATRESYGEALEKLGKKNKDIVVGDEGYISLCEECLRKRRSENEYGEVDCN